MAVGFEQRGRGGGEIAREGERKTGKRHIKSSGLSVDPSNRVSMVLRCPGVVRVPFYRQFSLLWIYVSCCLCKLVLLDRSSSGWLR